MFACHLAFAGVAGLVSTVATAGPRYPDFNGDGKTDLYFLDDYSRLVHTIWLMDGTRVTDSRSYVAAYTWSLQDRLGDRNGDGKPILSGSGSNMLPTRCQCGEGSRARLG